MLKPLSRDSLCKQVTDTLRRLVVTEPFQAGDQLPSERDLSESLSVSRAILREALSVLVAEGVIVKKAGRGIFVAEGFSPEALPAVPVTVDPSGHDLTALEEARAAVELGSVNLMVARITETQLKKLERINTDFAKNLEAKKSTVKNDIDFHTVLLEATRSPILVELIPLLTDFFRLSLYHHPEAMLHSPQRVVEEHGRIVKALRAKDAAATRAALLEHLHLSAFKHPE